jgi:hypothetical protein
MVVQFEVYWAIEHTRVGEAVSHSAQRMWLFQIGSYLLNILLIALIHKFLVLLLVSPPYVKKSTFVFQDQENQDVDECCKKINLQDSWDTVTYRIMHLYSSLIVSLLPVFVRFFFKCYWKFCDSPCGVQGKLYLFVFNIEPAHVVKTNIWPRAWRCNRENYTSWITFLCAGTFHFPFFLFGANYLFYMWHSFNPLHSHLTFAWQPAS